MWFLNTIMGTRTRSLKSKASNWTSGAKTYLTAEITRLPRRARNFISCGLFKVVVLDAFRIQGLRLAREAGLVSDTRRLDFPGPRFIVSRFRA